MSLSAKHELYQGNIIASSGLSERGDSQAAWLVSPQGMRFAKRLILGLFCDQEMLVPIGDS